MSDDCEYGSLRTGTIGVTKMQGNFVKILFQAKSLWKAKKCQEFCQNSCALLCTILYVTQEINKHQLLLQDLNQSLLQNSVVFCNFQSKHKFLMLVTLLFYSMLTLQKLARQPKCLKTLLTNRKET